MTQPSDSAQSFTMDDVNKAIVEQLQIDGRKSYSAIGKEVGLSEAAVRQRVQKLTENNVMQIVAVTDPFQLGFNRQALIGIKCAGNVTQVADQISLLQEINYCLAVAGSYDIFAEAICVDDTDLTHLLDSIRLIDGVVSTETFLMLSLRKEDYGWGTR